MIPTARWQIGTTDLAQILNFRGKQRSGPDPRQDSDARSEVIVFPSTNIRSLRRMWGLPEDGLRTAGPDGRSVDMTDAAGSARN